MKAGFMTDIHAGRGEGVRPEMVNLFRELIGAINRTGMRELSSKLDVKRVKDHWSTGLEMAAHSFETYIITKLQDQNESNGSSPTWSTKPCTRCWVPTDTRR